MNYQNARDMLAMYPQRYAEGGDVQEPVPTAQAPVAVPTQAAAPAQAAMRASQSWTAPSVQGRQQALTPIFAPGQVPADFQGRYIDPTVLSSSQQYARTRAEQQAALNQVLQQANAPISRKDRLSYAQQLRSGEMSIPDLQEKVLNPLLEKRVQNAYAAIGRKAGITDDPAASYASVRQSEYDDWLNKLKSGEVSGKDFENKFLTSVANLQGQDLTNQFDYVNNARKILGLPLNVKPAPKSTGIRTGINFGTGIMGAAPTYNPMMGAINLPKPAPAPKNPLPVNFSANTTPQLFNEGGDVKK